MPTTEIKARSIDQLRAAYHDALQEERQIVEELLRLSDEEEQAVEGADEFLISEVARRRAELPLKLAAKVRQRARLFVEVCEREVEEAAEERAKDREKANRAEEKFRQAEEKLEAARNDYAISDDDLRAAQERHRRAREALYMAQTMNPDALVERLVKEGNHA